MALMMPHVGEGKKVLPLLRWFKAMFDKCRTIKTRILTRRRAALAGARVYQPERRDAKICPVAEKHSAG
jgi:hypothetical protein